MTYPVLRIGAIAAVLTASAGANANLIVGGGFNDQTVFTNNWTVTSVSGSGNAKVDPGCCNLNTPQEGAGYLAFTGNNANSNSFAEQLISGLITGSTYQFSYYWAGRGGNNANNAQLRTTVTDTALGDIYDSTVVTNNPRGTWNQELLTFIAPSSAVSIRFAEVSTNSVSLGPAVDNAALVDIPVPGTLALLGLGLLGVSRRTRG